MLTDVAEILNTETTIRYFVFGMEACVFAFCIYYASDFIRKARRKKQNDLRNDMAYAWASFFILQAVMNALIVYADYFQDYLPATPPEFTPPFWRPYIINIAGVIGMIGLIIITLKSEQILGTYYLITVMLSMISVCVLIFPLFPMQYFTLFQTLAYITNIGIFYAAVRDRIGAHLLLKRQLKTFVYGFIIMAIAQLCRRDVILGIAFEMNVDWVYNIRFFADVGVLISLFILQYAFTEFPSLFELEWRKHLREIHVVHMKGGNEIYGYYFSDENADNSEIVGGFMYGVNQLVSEITGSDTALHMIRQKENVVCFEKTHLVIVVLIAKEYNEIYTIKLKQLLNQIMLDYGHLLEKWDGNKTPFKSIRELIEDVFK